MNQTADHNQALAQEAIGHLVQKHRPTGRRIGWTMIASIFIEAWDLYSIALLLVFLSTPRVRGTATGFAYVFVKLPSFLGIFLFPTLFTQIGKVNATFFTAIFPLVGLLAAIFILPEVYGYFEGRRGAGAGEAAAPAGLAAEAPAGG